LGGTFTAHTKHPADHQMAQIPQVMFCVSRLAAPVAEGRKLICSILAARSSDIALAFHARAEDWL
jgi:hypothetical protein